MTNLLDELKINSTKLGKLVLVTGDFNILHIGHIRLLRFAKECGDTLVVAVNGDTLLSNPNYNDEHHRLEMISALNFVDYSFVYNSTIDALISQIRPHKVVKGREHETQDNPEQAVLDGYGGKLVFSSGDTFQKSSSVFQMQTMQPLLNLEKINNFMIRHNITRDSVEKLLSSFKQLRVLVIGDTIIDEYMQCNAVGMSQEDPTIVVTPDEKKLFLGGAAITAAHANSLGAQDVSFITVLGDDDVADYAKNKLKEYRIDAKIFRDDTRPTTKKRRYRVGNKTLLRVNDFRDHDIGVDIQATILAKVKEKIKVTDLVVFSDFNYGVLPTPLVDTIVELCKSNKVMIAADSQTSSQVGDISRFKNVDLITPTEREIRVALNNTRDGLVILSEKLHLQTNCPNIIVTLAEEGALMHLTDTEKMGSWQNDKISALASNAIDPAGAGDCMLAATAMALVSGGDLWVSSLIGSVAAACQVSKVGNQPLAYQELQAAFEQLL